MHYALVRGSARMHLGGQEGVGVHALRALEEMVEEARCAIPSASSYESGGGWAREIAGVCTRRVSVRGLEAHAAKWTLNPKP